MPQIFTPKFLDMVRVTSTTVGTGPLTCGAAVPGFASFAESVTAGDNFYYSVQGVDKPTEREVGRGTYQANGTIARDPLKGTPTNFTPGAKTIALVASSEWYAKMEAGAGGSNGGGSEAPLRVASRAAMALLSAEAGTCRYLVEDGREGLFVFDTANHTALVAADTRQAVAIAPASAPSGASGAWLRQVDQMRFLFSWFGAVADGKENGEGTDNTPAMTAALAVLRQFMLNPAYTYDGPELFCPGWYRFSQTIELKQALRLTGLNNSAGTFGTLFFFPANKNGLIVQRRNTIGEDGSEEVTTGADGAIIDGIGVWGGGGSTGKGFVLRARARLENCFARNFAEDGFMVFADAVSGIGGNANCFHFHNCDAVYNGRHGFHFLGADANAGTIIGCNSSGNGAFGFMDASFLGNFFYGCHAEANGRVNYASAAGNGIVNFGGTGYYLKLGATSGATIQPGTNANVWVPLGASVSGAPLWVSGVAVQAGGAYAGSNPNARGSFDSCYAEGGQAPSQFQSKHSINGGFHAETGVSGGIHLYHGGGVGKLGTTEGIVTKNGTEFVNSIALLRGDGYWTGPATDFAMLYRNGTSGLTMYGKGSNSDLLIANSLGQEVAMIPTGSRSLRLLGDLQVEGALSANLGATAFTGAQAFPGPVTDRAYLYRSATLGLVTYGAGSSSDLFFANRNGTEVLAVPSGTTTLNCAGDVQLASGKVLRVAGQQVVGARQGGWTASTGAASRGAFAATAAGTASATYSATEMQAALTRIAALEARLVALEADCRSHGLIN